MTRRLALAGMLIALTSTSVRAQVPFPRTLIPTRPALGRVGLEKNWYAVVPLAFGAERLLKVSMAEDMLFAQTSRGYFHAFDAESGRLLWSTRLGQHTGDPQPASVNSDSVFVTNFQDFFALDRATGAVRWKYHLEAMPSTATAADEDRAMVGLTTGKLVGFTAKDHTKDKPDPGPRIGQFAFAWQTAGKVTGRPVPAGKVTAFGSGDGKLYVAVNEPPTLLYRYLTAGAIVGSLGTYGTRTILLPSADNVVYAVDLYNADTKWSFPTASPVVQEPLVANDDAYVLNERGALFALNARNGSARWVQSTGGGTLLAVGKTRVYMRSADRDMSIVDRNTGQMLFDGRATLERAGVNLRDYSMALTNAVNDRLYFATPSGFLLSLREIGEIKAVPLRDPKQPKFGYLPPEGDPQTPPPPPTPAPTTEESTPPPPEPGAEEKKEQDKMEEGDKPK